MEKELLILSKMVNAKINQFNGHYTSRLHGFYDFLDKSELAKEVYYQTLCKLYSVKYINIRLTKEDSFEGAIINIAKKGAGFLIENLGENITDLH